VREFVTRAAAELGVAVEWTGKGIEEVGVVAAAPADSALKCGQRIVAIDPRYFRPSEVDTLLGDPSKAREKLGWAPKVSFEGLVAEMMREDLKIAQRDSLIRSAGFRAFDHHE
jgi:GDPmannose 4,6-dehydratase